MKLFLGLFLSSYGRVLLEHLTQRESDKSYKKNLLLKYMYSEMSLLEGILALDQHSLHNLRFYSPYLKRHFDQTSDIRWFKADHGKDGKIKGNLNKLDSDSALAFVASKLFPSIGSCSLNIYSNHCGNFAKVLNLSRESSKNLEIYLDFLASILFCIFKRREIQDAKILRVDDGIRLEIIGKENQTKSVLLNFTAISTKTGDVCDNKELVFVLNTLLQINNSELNPVLDSKVLIKAFIASYLETRQELIYLYNFIDTVLCKYFKTEIISFDMDQSDKNKYDGILKTISTNYQNSLYENQEPTYMLMPFYLRDGQFDGSGKLFSNCVESSLYHFFNCLLWDAGIKAYHKINSKANQKSQISSIFSGELKDSPSQEEMKKWHVLLEDCPGGLIREHSDNKNISECFYRSFNNIYYCMNYKGTKNELKSGLINSLKVIEHLLECPNAYTKRIKDVLIENDLKIEQSVAEVEKIIKELLLSIFQGRLDASQIKVELQELKLRREDDSGLYNSTDLTGLLRVTKRYTNREEITFILDIRRNHQRLVIDKSENRKEIIDKRKNDAKFLKNQIEKNTGMHRSFCKILFYRYITLIKETDLVLDYIEANLNKDSPLLIYDLLYVIKLTPSNETCDFFVKVFLRFSSNVKLLRNVEEMVNSFFKSIPLDDEGTFSIFGAFQKHRISSFIKLDCFSNDFLLKKAISFIFILKENTEKLTSYVNLWKSSVKGLATRTHKDRFKIVAKYLDQVCFGSKMKYEAIDSLKIRVLDFFNTSLSLLSKIDPEISTKYFKWVPVIALYLDVDDLNATCIPALPSNYFYCRVLDLLESEDERMAILKILLFEKLQDKHREFYYDLEYYVLEKPSLVLDLLSDPNACCQIYFFLNFILHEKPENLERIVSTLKNIIFTDLFKAISTDHTEIQVSFYENIRIHSILVFVRSLVGSSISIPSNYCKLIIREVNSKLLLIEDVLDFDNGCVSFYFFISHKECYFIEALMANIYFIIQHLTVNAEANGKDVEEIKKMVLAEKPKEFDIGFFYMHENNGIHIDELLDRISYKKKTGIYLKQRSASYKRILAMLFSLYEKSSIILDLEDL